MSKYTNRADLLIAAGESIKMQKEAGINPVLKFNNIREKADEYNYNSLPDDYEFPIAVVEGKPVFVGDKLYDKTGHKWFADTEDYARNADNNMWLTYDKLTWNPPKPVTVMVEMLREDAEEYVSRVLNTPNTYQISSKICAQIQRALEK